MNSFYDGQIPQEIDPESGLPIGPLMDRSSPAKTPERVSLEGRFCRLEPLNSTIHGDALYAASTPIDAPARFRYLGDSPPASRAAFTQWLEAAAQSSDPLHFAVVDKHSGRAEGRQTLMRIAPEHQCIEIGNIYWGPAISQTPITTEAQYLFACYLFEELGFRRYEWKCDALNAPSRRAALRFGFKYEGHFRRAVIVRGRTRDTAWFSIIDSEWPALKAAFEAWLAPENFDVEGRQLTRLSDLTGAL
jgi:RimJ/RimL family protein N-acetyltransferase